MRDFVLLMVVCLVVVIAVGWFLFPGRGHDLFKTTVAVKAADPKPEPEKEATPAPKPHKRPAPPKVETAAVEPAAKLRTDLVVIPVTYAPKPVPAPGEVKVGAERAHIIDSFGDPNLSASTEDRGHLFETFVYKRDRRQAVIHLEDGRVAAVFAR